MARLYWRIFFVFWAVIILTIVVTASVNTVVSRDDAAESRFQALLASMEVLTEQAQRALDKDGEQGLRKWLEDAQTRLNAPIFVIDPDGNELRGQSLPVRLRWQLSNNRRLSRAYKTERRPDFRLGPRQQAHSLTNSRGEYTLLVLGIDRPGGIGMMPPNARRLFPLILALVSGIACFLLARYLTRPIRAFREAGRRIAAGDMSARVGAPVNRRKDELGALAIDFDRMAEQVEALLESKQRLLREVSHELRSPLARLQAATGLMRQQTGDADNPNVDRIEQEVETLNNMIGQILAFARLESMAQITREPVDVVSLVSEVVENARFEGRARGREVKFMAPENLAANLDPMLIQSAVDNVVRNAAQHSSLLATVTLLDTPEGIQIKVSDDGPGAPEEHLYQLFDAFFTAAPSNSAAGQGAGIGLAIAHRAVSLHGGTIAARNRTRGSGLEVKITLPGIPPCEL